MPYSTFFYPKVKEEEEVKEEEKEEEEEEESGFLAFLGSLLRSK